MKRNPFFDTNNVAQLLCRNFSTAPILLITCLTGCISLPGSSALFEYRCKNIAGYKIEQPIDAHDDGLFDYRLYQLQGLGKGYGSSITHFWKDVDLLISGRLSFFETHKVDSSIERIWRSSSKDKGPYDRWFLDQEGSIYCYKLSNRTQSIKAVLSRIPGRCLAVKSVDSLASKYEIRTEGFHADSDQVSTTKIIEIKSRNVIASYTSVYGHNPLWSPGNDVMPICPEYERETYSPKWTLPTMLFRDTKGEVNDLLQLEGKKAVDNH